ncbi:MAG: GDCCVxC domain-containing (seleno)protein [Betaproteobacteria bacterium]
MSAPAILESTLTCPSCDATSNQVMPTDACLFFWACPGCGTRHKPKAGDCCVFCSYGSVPCPPVQVEGGCCTR